MVKKVRYNGGNESYFLCSNPKDLVVGKEYEVTSSRERGLQTNYTIKGFNGEFNSLWFDDFFYEERVYIAISSEIPVLGERFHCSKIEVCNGNPEFINLQIGVVENVKYIGNSIYQVRTNNSIYFVKVG